MKKLWIIVALLVLVACGNTDEKSSSSEASKKDSTVEEKQLKTDNDSASDENEDSNQSTDHSGSNSTNTNDQNTSNNQALSNYSSEQIEYARVWLQLGPNQDIDGLYVQHISAGEPINPNDETSATYPEDVIQLAGSRLVDGSVTYSGNGNGTINVYNVPLRWDSSNPEVDENFMKEYTEDIIKNTELISINPGEDSNVIELIKLIK